VLLPACCTVRRLKGRKCCALLLFVSVASDAPASSVAEERQKATIGAVKAMEDRMEPWTLSELMHLTRRELCALECWITLSLPEWESGSIHRHNALLSLKNIRRLLALRRPRPGPV
jgi:hypothetical protein